jgi:uncharacterized protein YydD (DUF2326 family)
MKLVQIYANKSLQEIHFGDSLSVILAEVKKPEEIKKDSHNLGKSSLIELIDFLLLKRIDKNHIYKKHSAKFKGYVFFLEIKNNSGQYLTISRGVDDANYVHIKSSPNSINYILSNSFISTRHGLEEAKKIVEKFAGFDVLPEYSYRDTLTYFLRSQKDYQEVFQLSKNQKSKDIDWKPLIFEMLGFQSSPLVAKYQLDDEKKDLKTSLKRQESKPGFKTTETDKIKGLIQIKTNEKLAVESKLDDFNFEEAEMTIKKELATDIEMEVNILNTKEYDLALEEERLKVSLDRKIEFDLSRCEQIFKESKLYFGDQLKKDYDQLIEFNNKVVLERHKLLKERQKEIYEELDAVKANLKELNSSRTKLLAFLKEGDSFKKFKNYQKNLEVINSEISKLNEHLGRIDQIETLSTEIDDIGKKIKSLQKDISQTLKKGENDLYSNIRLTFSEIIKEVLNQPGIISIGLNTSGNVYFEANVQDAEKLEITEQGKGTTYKKILCAAFDLAILVNYSKKSFYRFVYHDGVFEGLDNRMKTRFYECVKRISTENDLQYIFTAIQDDMIKDKAGKMVAHPELQIAMRLNDSGSEGKLYKMDY